MKREREEGGGAAMSPSLGRPSPSTASAARVLGRPMEVPSASHSLRAPSPFVRAMRTRLDPPPPCPAAPPPPLPPPPSLLPQTLEKRRRGRPRNCDRLLPPPGLLLSPPARAVPALAAPRQTLAAHGQCHLDSGGLQPHVLKIDVGEDIVSRIVEVSQINRKAVCVLAVLGTVQEASLLHSSRVILNHKGPLEIIRMFGSILAYDFPGSECLSVTLACADCSVVGGVIAGPLIAATPVKAIVGSFYNNAFQPKKTPKIIACYPNSQVATGYGLTYYPTSPFAIGNGIRHYPNSQVGVATESTHCPGSQVAIGTGNMHYPNSEVATGSGSTNLPNSRFSIGEGSTHQSSPLFTLGDGSTHHSSSQATVGNERPHHPNSQRTVGTGSAHYPDFHVPIGDGSTRNSNCHVTVGEGSTENTNSQVTVDNGSTNNASFEVTVGDGSSHYPSSKVTVGNGSTPSIEGSNPECASCTAVEQHGLSEIDVKPSHAVA